MSMSGEGGGTWALASNAAGEFHKRLANSLGPQIQESQGEIVIDVCVADQKYVTRLWQRSDFPELFEGALRLADEDCDSRVELYVRFPRRMSNFVPYKLAEFRICKLEHFPVGF